jgi:hypothetical protein
MAAFGPTFEYRITGSTAVSVGPDTTAEFVATNFIVNFPGSGSSTGGNLSFGTSNSAIDITRPELFSDPVWAPNDLKYNDLGQWGYYSVLERIEAGEVRLGSRLVFASKTLAPSQLAFNDLFDSFFDANPTWDYVRVLDAVLFGPDINGGQGNNADFFAVAAFMNNAPFLGNVGTSFQPADTLTLYMVVTDSEGEAPVAQPLGNLTVNAVVIPEPAALGLLAPFALLLQRRR